jgi:phosphatidylserine/phosphatidylglycerophosphate/cardiolipin synthase-like enzyme
MEIMKQMLKAKTSIDFVMFTFAQSSGIDDTMFRLVPSLTRLRGALDREQGAQAWAATQPLKQAGVQLFQNKPGTGVRKIHHKLMVIDERLVIAGSFNYTGPAGTLNDENILILGDLEETNPAAETAQQQLAAYALAEIDRIITNLCEPVRCEQQPSSSLAAVRCPRRGSTMSLDLGCSVLSIGCVAVSL